MVRVPSPFAGPRRDPVLPDVGSSVGRWRGKRAVAKKVAPAPTKEPETDADE